MSAMIPGKQQQQPSRQQYQQQTSMQQQQLQQQRQGGKPTSQTVCYRCQKRGHFAHQCRAKRVQEVEVEPQQEPVAEMSMLRLAENLDEASWLFLLEVLPVECGHEEVVVGSAAEVHVCPLRSEALGR